MSCRPRGQVLLVASEPRCHVAAGVQMRCQLRSLGGVREKELSGRPPGLAGLVTPLTMGGATALGDIK